MATLRFRAESRSNKLYVVAFLTDEGKDRMKSLGYTVPKKECWDFKRQRARGCEEAIDINAKISRWEAVFQEYAGRVKRGEIEYNFDEISDLMEGTSKVHKRKLSQSITLAEAAWEVFRIKADTTTNGTAAHYKSIIPDLKDYDTENRIRTGLADVDKSFYQSFGRWLITERGNNNNTVNRKIGRIVTIMEWAFGKGLINHKRYLDRHQFRSAPSSRFPLTLNEVEAMAGYNPKSDWERVVLDAFLLSCETGLRVSDIWQLRPEHINIFDKSGIKYIDFTQVKGTKKNQIPLNAASIEILGRQTIQNGRFFGFKYSQSANRLLKDIAKEAGLNRLVEVVDTKGASSSRLTVPLHDIISFHFARNTYITNLLLLGVNPVFVQANAGHSDLKTTMKYNKEFAAERMNETLKVWNKKKPGGTEPNS